MRPETFRYKMNQAFDHWCETKSISHFLPLMREMKRVWKKWSKEEDDFRAGEETYDYKSQESMNNNMFYISDRWRCAFRLKWLIDGIESKKIVDDLSE